MATNSHSSVVKSDAVRQVKMLFVVKEQLDILYRQLNQFRRAFKSVDRLNRVVGGLVGSDDNNFTTDGQLDPDKLLGEFVKFERDYRVWKDKLLRLDQKIFDVDLYEKIYDLYESMIIGGECEVFDSTVDDNLREDSIEIKVECSGQNNTRVIKRRRLMAGSELNSDVSANNFEDFLQQSLLTESASVSSTVFRTVSTQTESINLEKQRNSKKSNTKTKLPSNRSTKTTKSKKALNGKSAPVDSDTSFENVLDPRATKKRNLRPVSTKTLKSKNDSKRKSFSSEDSTSIDSDSSFEDVYVPKATKRSKSSNSRLSKRPKTKAKKFVSRKKVCDSKVKVYECEHEGCDFTTDRMNSLRTHRSFHGDERPFKCRYEGCSSSYNFKQHLHQHVQIVHTKEAPLLRCEWEGCLFSSYRVQALKVHQKIHTASRLFRCTHCRQSYRTEKGLSMHMRLHTEEAEAEAEELSNSAEASSHQDDEPVELKCGWEGCDFGARLSGQIRKHQMSVHGMVKFRCTVFDCHYSSSVYYNLKTHLISHSQVRAFHCTKCDRKFKSRNHRDTHDRRVHSTIPGNAGILFRCQYEGCTSEYTKQQHLTQHVQIVHTKEAPLLYCGFEGCSYRSPRPQALKVHRTTHTDERPFQCKQCEERFKTKDHVYKHRIRVHDEEPRFRCVWPGCEQAYRSASSLSTHKRAHENIRKYKCKWSPGSCTYAANHSAHLNNHLYQVHLKLKPGAKPTDPAHLALLKSKGH